MAFGSSAPEIMVAATASFNGATDTAVGNALGSNITNIALVLGLTALLKPLSIASGTLKKEMPVLLAFSLLAVYLLSDFLLTRVEGIILISLFFLFIGGLTWMSFNMELNDPILSETESEIPSGVPTSKAILWLVVGMILLPLSAHFMVNSAEIIARHFGLSELVIGLTIIAIGTSLPELAASIASILKKEADIAIGNIIGSNMFNILAVLGIPALINPDYFASEVLTRDYPAMMGLSLLLGAMIFISSKGKLVRTEGAILLACFIGYQYILFSQTIMTT